jgi:UDP-N-acetyl-D-galactosamine dehydrogenase
MARPRVIAVIGLGYVGLPVAVAFGRKHETYGFDVNQERVRELVEGFDRTLEITREQLAQSRVAFSDRTEDLANANFFIVAVPTPVDAAKQPDLTALYRASETVGRALKPGDIVVYESTVYPGATEEECLPILERVSGLSAARGDFGIGYSPERINPGDPVHRFDNIRKVVSGQDAATLEVVAEVYGSVVEAGIHRAASIKVAEAAKVIENTQRDLNVALMNELALIFDRLGIDTHAVLEAAGTKWNFLSFVPGLVGGHCIGVDPYYLTHKAETVGYIPQVILAGRRINDGMGKYIAEKTVKLMILAGHTVRGNTVTVLGLSFKENCPDIRNTRVIDIIRGLQEYGLKVQVCDPLADADAARREYEIELVPLGKLAPASAIVTAVAHEAFRRLGLAELRKLVGENPVLVDVKNLYPSKEATAQGFQVWRL